MKTISIFFFTSPYFHGLPFKAKVLDHLKKIFDEESYDHKEEKEEDNNEEKSRSKLNPEDYDKALQITKALVYAEIHVLENAVGIAWM